MDKIAIGPGYPEGTWSTSTCIADGKHRPAGQGQGRCRSGDHHLHPRPAAPCQKLIDEVRATGAAIRLIGDGDVAGVIHTTDPESKPASTSISAPAARRKAFWRRRRCAASGGQMQGRLILDTPEKVARAAKMGIADPSKRSTAIEDLARGDVLFAATGVTDGNMLAGVKFTKNYDRDAHDRHAVVIAHRARDHRAAPGSRQVLSRASCRRQSKGGREHVHAYRHRFERSRPLAALL
jgi:fructose-1,6-bisphosphatase II / sedoheptulose-1,7-bisphosphatase